jgi:hypothetical protein
MRKYKIIEKTSGKDVTDELQAEYEQALKMRTDVEMYKAWGNHLSTIPSDMETRLIMLKNLGIKIFG